MNVLETVQTINLTKTADGTIRIGKTRVTLESVVHHFSVGATAEEIWQKFPSLSLGEVYGVIAYFLNNKESVAKYILEQEGDSDEIQFETESKFQTNEFRQRILDRWKNRQNILKP